MSRLSKQLSQERGMRVRRVNGTPRKTRKRDDFLTRLKRLSEKVATNQISREQAVQKIIAFKH